jgi:hypothetical protein
MSQAISEDRLFDYYKLMLDQAGQLRQARRETNNYFMSINVAALGGLGFLLKEMSDQWVGPELILLLAGGMILVCLLWRNAILHYARLSSIKFSIIREIESGLPMQPVRDEWARFTKGANGRGQSGIEIYVPILFAFGYILLSLLPFAGDISWAFGNAFDWVVSRFQN